MDISSAVSQVAACICAGTHMAMTPLPVTLLIVTSMSTVSLVSFCSSTPSLPQSKSPSERQMCKYTSARENPAHAHARLHAPFSIWPAPMMLQLSSRQFAWPCATTTVDGMPFRFLTNTGVAWMFA
jgi:hypothetical protein